MPGPELTQWMGVKVRGRAKSPPLPPLKRSPNLPNN
jgi:hypothetical protein